MTVKDLVFLLERENQKTKIIIKTGSRLRELKHFSLKMVSVFRDGMVFPVPTNQQPPELVVVLSTEEKE